jgi:hypothetical protein
MLASDLSGKCSLYPRSTTQRPLLKLWQLRSHERLKHRISYLLEQNAKLV